jgi:hypothetical protein
MLDAVFPLGTDDHQVRASVIGLHLIPVVHQFAWPQPAPKGLLRNESVLIRVAAAIRKVMTCANANEDVTAWVDDPTALPETVAWPTWHRRAYQFPLM